MTITQRIAKLQKTLREIKSELDDYRVLFSIPGKRSVRMKNGSVYKVSVERIIR